MTAGLETIAIRIPGHRAMQALLAAGRGESWARSAAEFGYYDESHMINDIKALADATPQELLGERTMQIGSGRLQPSG